MIRKGERYKIQTRGFIGIVEFIQDVEDFNVDAFMPVVIVEGTKQYLSNNRKNESVGDIISIRTTLTTLINKIS